MNILRKTLVATAAAACFASLACPAMAAVDASSPFVGLTLMGRTMAWLKTTVNASDCGSVQSEACGVGYAQAMVLTDPVTGYAMGSAADPLNVNPLPIDAVQPDISITANAQSTVIDALGSGGVSLAVSGTFTATFQVQWSNKVAGPWVAGVCWGAATTGASTTAALVSTTVVGQYVCPKFGRYLNIVSTAYTSGTVVITPALLAQRPGLPSSFGGATLATSADAGTLSAAIRTDSITKLYNGTTEDLARSLPAQDGTGKGVFPVGKVAPVVVTYSASAAGLVPAASATDIFTIVGSATKTVRVTRLDMSCTATASTEVGVYLKKYSSAASGGTAGTPPAIPLDSTFGAASATVRSYTANPTPGTSLGNLRNAYVPFNAPATSGPVEKVFLFGDTWGAPLVLRGVAEYAAINLGGVTVTGNVCNIDVEWTEQ